jgi:hypothetical protein
MFMGSTNGRLLVAVELEKDLAVDSIYGGLAAAVERAGAELIGFSVSFRGVDVLLTIRAKFPGSRMVGFVGAQTLPAALGKAANEASMDGFRWKTDNYSRK